MKTEYAPTKTTEESLFNLVPAYPGDETSLFLSGQKSANKDFIEKRGFSKSLRFFNADVSAGYCHEWDRLQNIKTLQHQSTLKL